MSERLPWVAAAVVIVIVAGMAAWLFSAPAPAFGTIAWAGGTSGVFAAAGGKWVALTGPLSTADNSAIENIYIVDNGTRVKLADASTENENLADHWLIPGFNQGDNYLLNGASDPIITDNNYADNATIPYEVPFEIVVAAVVIADADYVGDKGDARLVAYVNPENVYMTLDWWGSLVDPSETSSQGTIDENTQVTGYEYPFDNNCPWESGAANDGSRGGVGTGWQAGPYPDILSTLGNDVDYARLNFVFTRNNNGFTLPAGGSIDISVTLWVWA